MADGFVVPRLSINPTPSFPDFAHRVRITECPLKKLNGIYEHVEGESHNGRPSYILKRGERSEDDNLVLWSWHNGSLSKKGQGG